MIPCPLLWIFPIIKDLCHGSGNTSAHTTVIASTCIYIIRAIVIVRRFLSPFRFNKRFHRCGGFLHMKIAINHLRPLCLDRHTVRIGLQEGRIHFIAITPHPPAQIVRHVGGIKTAGSGITQNWRATLVTGDNDKTAVAIVKDVIVVGVTGRFLHVFHWCSGIKLQTCGTFLRLMLRIETFRHLLCCLYINLLRIG